MGGAGDVAGDSRDVTRGMHVLLYVLTALTFLVGTQLLGLGSDHDHAGREARR